VTENIFGVEGFVVVYVLGFVLLLLGVVFGFLSQCFDYVKEHVLTSPFQPLPPSTSSMKVFLEIVRSETQVSVAQNR